MKFLHYLMIITVLTGLICSCQGNKNTDDMNQMEVEKEAEIELLVKEPLVIDPVAYTFDENGRLYVVEDRGYPDPVDDSVIVPREGRIALLEDTDGDGTYDKRYEFADSLGYPNGILPWKGGVFVTCAPDIWYFKDTTGDGVTDIREKVLSGFFDTKTAQIRISHPTLGPDGWIYVSSGLNGGKVYSPLHPEYDTVSYSASDGRFDPVTYKFETVGGTSQFGMAFDAYGHRFGVSNRHPIQQVVIEPRFLNRNQYLPFNNTVRDVSKVAADAVVFPISNVVTTSEYMPVLIGQSHKGTFTSASSTYIYYGQGFDSSHQGNAFICESAQNLVQRQILIPDGASFKSELAYDGHEFLASKDQWFRPVYVNNGPDDALYVVDMNREIIDHPAYVPKELRDSLDFNAGKDKGRIYRIVRKGYSMNLKNKKWFPGNPKVEDLISKLDSDNEWDCETAFRMMVEGWDGTDAEKVKQIALSSKNPRNRARALNILGIKKLLTADLLVKALKDPISGVRERAILLSSNLASTNNDLKDALIATAKDANEMVRLQDALVLGSLEGENVIQALAEIADKSGDDGWIREAVLSGLNGRMDVFLMALRNQNAEESVGYAPIMRDLSQMFGIGAPLTDCQKLVDYIVNNEKNLSVKFNSMLGLAMGVTTRKEAMGKEDILGWLMNGIDRVNKEKFLSQLTESAKKDIKTGSKDLSSIRLLGYTLNPMTLDILQSAIRPEASLEVQDAGVQALVNQQKKTSGEILVKKENWRSFSPQIRSSVISAMVSHSIYLPILLEAIQKGVVPATDIPSITRQRLLSSKDIKIKEVAKSVFSDIEGGDRMMVYEEYKKKLTGKGDPLSGEKVFKQTCSVCHSYNGNGGHVGPDLTDVKSQPAEAILLHILVPNYEVYPTYQTISIETKSGQQISGWTVSETDNGITLRTAGGNDVNVLRSNIKEMTNTGQSLMPNGLEKAMTDQELNDLIAFIKRG